MEKIKKHKYIQTGEERGEAFQVPKLFKPPIYDECRKCYKSIKSLVTLEYTRGLTIGPLVLCQKCGEDLGDKILFEWFCRVFS